MKPRLLAALLPLALLACREPDRPAAPQFDLTLVVDSDPAGARILVDRQALGVTPDTLVGLENKDHDVVVQLDTAGLGYGYSSRFRASAETLRYLLGPLVLNEAFRGAVSMHSPNQLRFATKPLGPLLYRAATESGLLWPASSSNGYAAAGNPVIAGLFENRDTVALGPYDFFHYRGRPAPVVRNEGGAFRLDQSFWVMPYAEVLGLRTIRGIEIEERLFTIPGQEDALGIRLVFRNITNRPAYRAADPGVPAAGLTLHDTYIGYALDADVGDARDDALTFLPELTASVVYDSDLRETEFGADMARPGAVGLRLLERPAGSVAVMNGFTIAQEWRAADLTHMNVRESAGHRWLSGADRKRQYGQARIGVVSDGVNDWRAVVAAGPLRLAPGDSAAITVAIVLAHPAPGTFTSGTAMPAGDPDDAGRAAARMLGPLAEKLRALDGR